MQQPPLPLYVRATAACKILGISESMMRRLCRRGKFNAQKHGKVWYVDIASPRVITKWGIKGSTVSPEFFRNLGLTVSKQVKRASQGPNERG